MLRCDVDSDLGTILVSNRPLGFFAVFGSCSSIGGSFSRAAVDEVGGGAAPLTCAGPSTMGAGGTFPLVLGGKGLESPDVFFAPASGAW